MRNTKWMVLILLAASVTAAAKRKDAAPQPDADQAQTNMTPPTTMDQVVDRAIIREKGLVKFLEQRTPIVETYLQDMGQDPKIGPVPKETTISLAAWICARR